MPGYTQLGLRQAFSMSRLLHAMRYMFAVGPARSLMTPVKPGTVSRTCSISLRMLFSERLWIMRPSCSVMLQKVQPPKHPRWMAMENLIILYAGISALPYTGCGLRAYGSSYTKSMSFVVRGIGG